MSAQLQSVPARWNVRFSGSTGFWAVAYGQEIVMTCATKERAERLLNDLFRTNQRDFK